ncbi:nickel ABC transporter substrate-binding protein [Xanthobacteraceae bacterium A53D]
MAPQGAVAAQTRLTFSWLTNVGPLNPHLYAPDQIFAVAMVYEPLVKYQADGSFAPWLAESWDISQDGRTYTFRLRQGVTFSNGEPFDAAAVVANFNAILAEQPRHAWLELTKRITAIEALDAHTVRMTLSESYYPTLAELSLSRPFRFAAPSQFRNGGSADGLLAPIGTGPWILKSTRLGQDDLFVRNERYWGVRPALDEIEVKVIIDPNARAVAMEAGVLDLIFGSEGPIFPEVFARFKTMPGFTAKVSRPVETRFLTINANRGPTRDIAVRKAINHAVNKALITQTVLAGTQLPADTLFAPSVPYADVGLKPYAFDPVLARKMLDDAGWITGADGIRRKGDERLSIDLSFIGPDAVAKTLAEIIHAQLADIGIEVTLIGEEESSVYARHRDGRFGMIFNRTWGGPYDPHGFLSATRFPTHADYQSQQGLPDKEQIREQIGAVLRSTDDAERRQLYRDILTRLHEAAVHLPLTYATTLIVSRPRFGDIPTAPLASEIPFERIRLEAR